MANEKEEMSDKSESKKRSRYHKDEHNSSRKDKERSNKRKSHKKSEERERSRSPTKSLPERYRKSRRSRTRSRSRSAQVEKDPKEGRKEQYEEFSPDICHCLGVFGLSSFTDEKDLKDVFGVYGEIENISIIYDRQSRSSKGFGFVYFKSVAAAIEAKKDTQGLVLDNRSIRVDYSLTTSPHPPTPGRYLGRKYPDDRRCYGRGDYRSAGYNINESYERDRYDRYERDRYSSYYSKEDDYRHYYRDCYSGSGRSSRRYSPYSRRH